METLNNTTLEKGRVSGLINSFLKQFEIACNRQSAPTREEFTPFLSDDFQILSNGRLGAKNLLEYLERVKTFQKSFSHVEVSNLLEEPLISGNRVVVQYQADLVTQPTQKNFQAIYMVIVSIENDRITSWTQIVHRMGKDFLDD